MVWSMQDRTLPAQVLLLGGNTGITGSGVMHAEQNTLHPFARQAMRSATRTLLDGAWAGSGPREVYADLNALTLRITTEALFGSNLPPAESARVTGVHIQAGLHCRCFWRPAMAHHHFIPAQFAPPVPRSLHSHFHVIACMRPACARRHPGRVRVLCGPRGARLPRPGVAADAGQRGLPPGSGAAGRCSVRHHRCAAGGAGWLREPAAAG